MAGFFSHPSSHLASPEHLSMSTRPHRLLPSSSLRRRLLCASGMAEVSGVATKRGIRIFSLCFSSCAHIPCVGAFKWVEFGLKRELEESEKMADSGRPVLLSSRRLGKAVPLPSHLSPILDSLVGKGNYSLFF